MTAVSGPRNTKNSSSDNPRTAQPPKVLTLLCEERVAYLYQSSVEHNKVVQFQKLRIGHVVR